MGGFDPDAYLSQTDTIEAESKFNPDAYLSESTDTSGIPTVTINESNEITPVNKNGNPLNLSGKNLDIIKKIAAETFSSQPELFKDSKYVDVFYNSLLNNGYTKDDIRVLKGQVQDNSYLYDEPNQQVWSGGAASDSPSKLKAIQPTQKTEPATGETFIEADIKSIGGEKNLKIFEATKDLFISDPKYMDQDNREAYYGTLKEKLGDRNAQKIIDAVSGWRTAAYAASPITMGAQMLEAGINEWKKIPQVIAEEGTGAGTLVALKGLVDIGLGVIGSTPHGMAFIYAMNAGAEVAPHTVEAIMAPVTTGAKKVGYEPQSEGAKALMGMADLAAFTVFLGTGKAAKDYYTPKGQEALKTILDPQHRENKAMQIQELTDQYGKLSQKQRNDAANLWYDMKMRQVQGKGGEYYKAPFSAGKNIMPSEAAISAIEAAAAHSEGKKTEYEQAKIEITSPVISDTPEKVSLALSDVYPKLKSYVDNFSPEIQIGEVASGLNVMYKGKSGVIGRSDSGEITFTDVSNGKTEIVTGGGNQASFSDLGFKINEGYYSDKHGDYYVSGDNTGYTVYKVKDGKATPVYEGELANKERKDAIIRKALGKTDAEIKRTAAENRAEQLKTDAEKVKGTAIENSLLQEAAKSEADIPAFTDEISQEAGIRAAVETATVVLRDEITTITDAMDGASPEGKKVLETELTKKRTELAELEKANGEIEVTESAKQEGSVKRINKEIEKTHNEIVSEISKYMKDDISNLRNNLSETNMNLFLEKMKALNIIKIDC